MNLIPAEVEVTLFNLQSLSFHDRLFHIVEEGSQVNSVQHAGGTTLRAWLWWIFPQRKGSKQRSRDRAAPKHKVAREPQDPAFECQICMFVQLRT
jgi:hypothetical protein